MLNLMFPFVVLDTTLTRGYCTFPETDDSRMHSTKKGSEVR